MAPTDWMKKMKLIDLTHPISEDMPVYPGTEPPVVVAGCTVAEHGFYERKISMYTHTGTHVDPPAHLLEDGKTLDDFSVDHFFGPAAVIDVSGTENRTIEVAELEPHLERIEGIDFLLIRTGWSRYWGTDRYFSGFPVLSLEAAGMVAELGLKGIGFDTISPDPVESKSLPVHRVLMAAELILIENLTHLEQLPEGPFHLSCFPLAFVDADGSPVRAVALVDQGA